MRALGRLIANLMRGAVRCMFPLTSLAVLAVLLFCDQGRDVVRALVEHAAFQTYGHGVGGLVFLGIGAALLSLSVWYSMRWLLTAEMPGLPLPSPPGMLQHWAPRLAGASAPALVALCLYTLDVSQTLSPQAARAATLMAGHVFALLAALLLVFYRVRGPLMEKLFRLGWMQSMVGRHGTQPHVIGAATPLPSLTLRIILWSIVLTLLVALLVVLYPIALPRVIGAAAVAALALVSINLFGSFALTYWPLRRGLPPLAPWVLIAAGVLGAWNDNHVVQPASGAEAAAPPRVDVAKDFAAFLQRVDPSGSGEAPVIFVASEGGGIRAAYWTAAVLDALAKRSPLLDTHLYALSGVSGGSLGVTAWLASRRGAYCGNGAAASATRALGMDFVSPAVAGLLYYDLAQRFWPWPVQRFDRSHALEQGWQRAFSPLPGQPFEHPLHALYAQCERLPQLLLNSTRVETGQRAVLTWLADGPFAYSFDAMGAHYTVATQSLAGVVHHSARFPVVSPAGTVEQVSADGTHTPRFRLVDGGYFDNSGIETVLDLLDTLRVKHHLAFRPVLLLVRNDATPLDGHSVRPDAAPGRAFPELGSVIGALYNARGAHAVTARMAALRDRGIDVIDLVVPDDSPAAQAPLGWALSDSVRASFDAAAAPVAEAAAQRLAHIQAGLGPGRSGMDPK